ncbi:MAG: carboxypeptidase-like regulatory domain-containing protein [Bryobacteraceae bacterium]
MKNPWIAMQAVVFRACLASVLFLATGFGRQSPSPQTYRLSGTAVDSETRSPLPGTEVQVSPIGKPDLIESVIADANGRFEFSNLFAGKYSLEAVRSGYLRSSFEQHGRYSTAVVVGPGLSATDLIFPLKRKASISGTITDQDGEPVPHATVEALRQSVVEGLRAITDAGSGNAGEDGKYRIGGLESGTYFLVVTAQPWYSQQAIASEHELSVVGRIPTENAPDSKLDAAYPVTYYPGVSDDSEAAPIQLLAGTHSEANLSLTATPAVHAIVPRSGGVNARLEAVNHWGASIPLRSVFFNRQGQVFTVAPGRYELSAGWRDSAGQHSARKIIEIGGSVTIDPASLDDQRSVFASLGDAFSSARLSPSNLALRDLSTLRILRPVSSSKGQARWSAQELTSGRYELFFSGPEDFYVERVTATNAKVMGRTIEFGADGPVQIQVRLGRGTALLNGTVKQNGAPAAGAMVLMLRDDFPYAPSLIRRDQSDSDGTFSLANIVPGSYTLLALPSDDNLEYARADVMQRYLSKGKRILIAPSGRYSETIELTGDNP